MPIDTLLFFGDLEVILHSNVSLYLRNHFSTICVIEEEPQNITWSELNTCISSGTANCVLSPYPDFILRMY